MTGLEIGLIIIGFFCVCLSAFISGKKTTRQDEADEIQTSAVWTEKEEQMIRSRVNEILAERQDELVEKTKEQMSRLCNDKIMAVDEFSRQVLEKIENNHQEVVFMYNMLNEKEKDIKERVAEPVVAKPASLGQKTAKTKIEKKKIEEPKAENEKTAVQRLQKPVVSDTSDKTKDVNSRIRKMYQEGKTVLDISRELNIGQGEVKLVIALYGGKKK